jgi:hypothetical protein
MVSQLKKALRDRGKGQVLKQRRAFPSSQAEAVPFIEAIKAWLDKAAPK